MEFKIPFFREKPYPKLFKFFKYFTFLNSFMMLLELSVELSSTTKISYSLIFLFPEHIFWISNITFFMVILAIAATLVNSSILFYSWKKEVK